jgi:hypothetical protein
MSKPYKNILQEYFQAKKLDIPVYNTILLNTVPLQFQSTVTLCKHYGSFSGLPKLQKKMAEGSAAQIALEKLGLIAGKEDIKHHGLDLEDTEKENIEKYSNSQLFKFDWTVDNPIIILVDLENVSKLSSLETFIQNYQLDNVKLIKIASHTSSLKNQSNYVANSSNKDAADHLLTYLVGLLSGAITVHFKLLVLTSDHFGGALEDILKYNPLIHLRHVTCQDDCINMLHTFMNDL